MAAVLVNGILAENALNWRREISPMTVGMGAKPPRSSGGDPSGESHSQSHSLTHSHSPTLELSLPFLTPHAAVPSPSHRQPYHCVRPRARTVRPRTRVEARCRPLQSRSVSSCRPFILVVVLSTPDLEGRRRPFQLQTRSSSRPSQARCSSRRLCTSRMDGSNFTPTENNSASANNARELIQTTHNEITPAGDSQTNEANAQERTQEEGQEGSQTVQSVQIKVVQIKND
ncbi:hypothetical protein PIB30_048510 [Stylosanthes scabra]|uniref:Uncharacterized protein n=1 Tax=Stylosanthes scabra TaxID=79078 RepID=A0ABU6VJD6_9FABA|nr:hypothetical protein [Stylosanthes scabra]